jgi:uncharacterized protein
MSMPSAALSTVLEAPNRQTVPRAVWQVLAASVGLLLLLGGMAASLTTAGVRPVLGWALGAALGAVFVAASFGFSAGVRRFFTLGDSQHLRAQLLMVGVALALFTPALAAGDVLGFPVRGYVFPIGLALVAGGVLFGIGMQIAGACGSGMLAALGGGSARMIVAFLAFISGATLAVATSEAWSTLPRLPAFSFTSSLGLAGGIAVQVALIAALWLGLALVERARRGAVVSLFQKRSGDLLSPGMGAVLIAALSFATLAALGRPWTLSMPFALWGSWGVEVSGLDDPTFWSFWGDPTRVDLYQRAAFSDPSSVMNLGMILGALMAAGLTLRFIPVWHLPLRSFLAALIGGLFLGYGAVLGTGCNIGAFLAGAASGSGHGWVWLAAALAGNAIGLLFRPLFGLSR